MKQIFFRPSIILLVICSLFIATSIVLSDSTMAQTIKDDIQTGVNQTTGGTGTNPDSTLQKAVTGAVNILTFIVGAIAVVMIIYAGYLYVTSSGDSSKISTAKSALLYAIIGIAVAAVAQIAVQFLINYF